MLVFIVPLCAWVSATSYNNSKAVEVVALNKDRLISVVRTYIKERGGSTVHSVDYISYKIYNNNWYFVKVRDRSDKSIIYNVVVADFKEPQVVLGPGEVLSQLNISNIGIPYEIIDQLYSGTGGGNS